MEIAGTVAHPSPDSRSRCLWRPFVINPRHLDSQMYLPTLVRELHASNSQLPSGCSGSSTPTACCSRRAAGRRQPQ